VFTERLPGNALIKSRFNIIDDNGYGDIRESSCWKLLEFWNFEMGQFQAYALIIVILGLGYHSYLLFSLEVFLK
jgi:hypothetical protein